MWSRYRSLNICRQLSAFVKRRHFGRIGIPAPATVQPGWVIRVSKHNITRLGPPKKGPKPRQLLSLPPFPGTPLPGKTDQASPRVTAAMWLSYYFKEVNSSVIESHFSNGLVQMKCSGDNDSLIDKEGKMKPMREISPREVMEKGTVIYVSVSIAESKISKRFDVVPSGTLYPNKDEIAYFQRLVHYKDYAIIVLNKPSRFPVKGPQPIHNSMDALAAAALSFENKEGPKLVHRLDTEASGLLLMGRNKNSVKCLELLFGDKTKESLCKGWDRASEATYQKYWALVIGSPKEKEGVISAPLTKVLIDDGKLQRVLLAHKTGFEVSQEAITEYRALGPMINGCTWLELRPLTSRKHQLRVHCAEALGTPIVGDYKYGWFVHKRWQQTSHETIEPTSGRPYRMRRAARLDVHKGSVMSKVPLLHLHCREIVLPNITKFLQVFDTNPEIFNPTLASTPDLLRFVALMPPHMRISWNYMSSYLV